MNFKTYVIFQRRIPSRPNIKPFFRTLKEIQNKFLDLPCDWDLFQMLTASFLALASAFNQVSWKLVCWKKNMYKNQTKEINKQLSNLLFALRRSKLICKSVKKKKCHVYVWNKQKHGVKSLPITRQLLDKSLFSSIYFEVFCFISNIRGARAVLWCFRLFFTPVHLLIIHKNLSAAKQQEIKTKPEAKPPSRSQRKRSCLSGDQTWQRCCDTSRTCH